MSQGFLTKEVISAQPGVVESHSDYTSTKTTEMMTGIEPASHNWRKCVCCHLHHITTAPEGQAQEISNLLKELPILNKT